MLEEMSKPDAAIDLSPAIKQQQGVSKWEKGRARRPKAHLRQPLSELSTSAGEVS
jgi:hypothetical protein